MTTCGRCETSYTSGRAEHCVSCHRTFSNTLAGDRHRIGRHGTTSGSDRRRCRTEVEMVAAGLIRNSRGYWTRDRGEGTSPSAINVAGVTEASEGTGHSQAALLTADGTRFDGLGAAA